MTLAALANACGVSSRAVRSWEKGETAPTERHTQEVAAVLGFPVKFFAGDPPDEIAVGTASFRALTKMTARQRDRALNAGRLAFMLDDWITERFERPSPNVPDLADTEPEIAAETVRAQWGLGVLAAANMVHLLEANGVRVYSLREETNDVDAFSLWRDTTPFVFLNTRKSAERSRFDAAHELGHLALHRGHREPHGREREREADAFAAAFLMPATSVRAVAPSAPMLEDIVKVRSVWRVSVAALVHRMSALGLLTEWRARHLWVEIGRRGYRREEPRPTAPFESSLVLTKVAEALREDGMRWSDVAADLAITADDLSDLVFGLVTVPIGGGGESGGSARAELRLVPD